MTEKETIKAKIKNIAYIAMFAAVMAVCAWISVPMTVPFTLQTFGVFLTVGVLGGKRGTLSVLVYLLLGIVGLPVFSGFRGGAACIIGTTGGYIVGFLFTALVMWAMEALLGKKNWVLILSMVIGLIVCYAFGTAWFVIVYTNTKGAIGIWTALLNCVIPYLIPDAIKIALAFLITNRLRKHVQI